MRLTQSVVDACKRVETEGLLDTNHHENTALIRLLQSLMAQLDEEIRIGESEYAGSTVSTAESRQYEDATYAREQLRQFLVQQRDASSKTTYARTIQAIVHSIIEHNIQNNDNFTLDLSKIAVERVQTANI